MGNLQNMGIIFCMYFKNKINMIIGMHKSHNVMYPAYTVGELCLICFKLVFFKFILFFLIFLDFFK